MVEDKTPLYDHPASVIENKWVNEDESNGDPRALYVRIAPAQEKDIKMLCHGRILEEAIRFVGSLECRQFDA